MAGKLTGLEFRILRRSLPLFKLMQKALGEARSPQGYSLKMASMAFLGTRLMTSGWHRSSCDCCQVAR